MKVTVLLENTACTPDLKAAHGLSLYVETPRHHILFDMGPSAAFAENAQALGVDLEGVDVAFLSHGHYDHAGGLDLFCRRNSRAKIYLHAQALGPYYSTGRGEPRYIGVDPEITAHRGRLVLCPGDLVIDDELQVFSSIQTDDYPTAANLSLKVQAAEGLIPDPFLHEQNLLITAGGKTVLAAGCAHRGVVNILRRAEQLLGRSPDAVFSGFHLYNPATGQSEPRELIEAVAEELSARPDTRYYTGHCTGQEAFDILKEKLGDRLSYMGGGSVFTL